jgi:hypothetical protein
MNKSAAGNGAGWLGMMGVAIGLIVALFVDRLAADTMVDRPLVIAGITAAVAVLWLVAIRLVFGPTPARAKVTNRSQP